MSSNVQSECGPWGEFRHQMPVAKRWAYLDHAAVAPLPRVAVEAMEAWARQACEDGDTAWPSWFRRVEQVRELAASLINATSDEIALAPNTTTGISWVAEGFPWREGDNVVTLEHEFPSNLFPWLHLATRGVETRQVPCDGGRVDLDRLMAACDKRTRIVAVSWVGYASGWRLDVGELADRVHANGSLLCLDAIQGIGVFPLDVRATDVDFVAADGHKWMLGPEGAGLFYLKLNHLDRLRPLGVGWQSVTQRSDFSVADFSLRPEAARYEGGTLNTAGFLGLGASLDLLAAHGLRATESPLANRVLEIANYAVEELRRVGAQTLFTRDPAHATGIITFSLPGQEPRSLRAACLQAGVVLSVRGGGLRISLHAYNNREDVDRLIDCLSSVSRAAANS